MSVSQSATKGVARWNPAAIHSDRDISLTAFIRPLRGSLFFWLFLIVGGPAGSSKFTLDHAAITFGRLLGCFRSRHCFLLGKGISALPFRAPPLWHAFLPDALPASRAP